MIRTTFTSDNGIYGKADHDAYATRKGSAFAVFKGHNLWTLGHPRSGLSMDALIPVTLQRTRKALGEFVARLEASHPEACEVLEGVTSAAGLSPVQREAMLALVHAAQRDPAA